MRKLRETTLLCVSLPPNISFSRILAFSRYHHSPGVCESIGSAFFRCSPKLNHLSEQLQREKRSRKTRSASVLVSFSSSSSPARTHTSSRKHVRTYVPLTDRIAVSQHVRYHAHNSLPPCLAITLSSFYAKSRTTCLFSNISLSLHQTISLTPKQTDSINLNHG